MHSGCNVFRTTEWVRGVAEYLRTGSVVVVAGVVLALKQEQFNLPLVRDSTQTPARSPFPTRSINVAGALTDR